MTYKNDVVDETTGGVVEFDGSTPCPICDVIVCPFCQGRDESCDGAHLDHDKFER